MKRTVLLLIAAVAVVQAVSAQTYGERHYKRFWMDLQMAHHFGLDKWSDAGYANDGFPGASLTEFRAVANIFLAKPAFGLYLDMGLGIMPAPRMRTFDPAGMPMPNSGTRYYMREMLSESGVNSATAHFRISTGMFGNFRAAQRLDIMPYLGVGGLTMSGRGYEMILKEDGSNNQYHATYRWGPGSGGEYGSDSQMLGYLSGRLLFKYKLNGKSSLVLGLEYTRFFDTMNFYGRYSNTFNGNIRRSFSVEGDNMNMLGVSLGISFM